MSKWLRISDFAEVVTGGTPSTEKKEYWENGSIPWLPSGVCQDSRVYSANDFITEVGLKNSAAKMMPPKTVLIALTGATTGKTAILEFDACANQSVTGIVPNDRFVPEYLFYYLRSIRQKILFDNYGGAQKHISQGYVKDIKVPLPPLDEQKRIAAVLDKVQSLIDLRKKQISDMDVLAQSVFLDMFGDPVKNEKGLEVKTLRDCCFSIKDGPHISPKYVDLGVPFLTVNNIINGYWDLDNVRYISEEDYETYSKRSKPEYEDVLYTKGGTTGYAKYIDIKMKFMNWVHIAVLKYKKEILAGKFLEFMLNTDFCYKQSQQYTRGIANRDLVLGQMSKINILVPPKKIQEIEIFIQKIGAIESQKQQMQQGLALLEQNYNALMQQYFS